MVSQFALPLTLTTFHLTVVLLLNGQTPPAPPAGSGFRDVSNTTTAAAQPSGPVPTVVSAETRGDIFMAKKMFREAVEVYKEGGPNSAVMLAHSTRNSCTSAPSCGLGVIVRIS